MLVESKQPCVFGGSLGWELLTYAVSIIIVNLAEPPVLSVFSLSSSTTRGLSEVCQKISWVLVRNVLGTHLDCYQLHWIDLSFLCSRVAGRLAEREAV